MTTKEFQEKVWKYYRANRRDLPWRNTTNPYQIMVSEIMLQQTQADRVVSYYHNFLEKFPTITALADAQLPELLASWKGLGYNRRALFLKKAAEKIITDFGGKVPKNINELITLPGVGIHTAGAIRAYAFDLPVIFLETNIRKTIIYFFFPDQEIITDKEIIQKIEETLPTKNIREWYWALVDYGSLLGRSKVITNDRSKHYVKQSTFKGSSRQLRSAILWQVMDKPQTIAELEKNLDTEQVKISQQLTALQAEGLITKIKQKYIIR